MEGSWLRDVSFFWVDSLGARLVVLLLRPLLLYLLLLLLLPLLLQLQILLVIQ